MLRKTRNTGGTQDNLRKRIRKHIGNLRIPRSTQENYCKATRDKLSKTLGRKTQETQENSKQDNLGNAGKPRIGEPKKTQEERVANYSKEPSETRENLEERVQENHGKPRTSGKTIKTKEYGGTSQDQPMKTAESRANGGKRRASFPKAETTWVRIP